MVIDSLGGGRIEQRELSEEMRSSYLDYAMSVIVSRALPDVRDGLKPVHRRVLFSMSECRLQKLAVEMLRDIDADTVDFVPNYDGRHREPTVLPSRFPNLLVNGSAGIAVGMATNIPPHNLGETIDAAVELIDNPEATLDDIMHHIKGPDFPTAATVMGLGGIREA